MSKWEKAAVIALASEASFCWIESRQQADEEDVIFY